jgi:hypothetical protein
MSTLAPSGVGRRCLMRTAVPTDVWPAPAQERRGRLDGRRLHPRDEPRRRGPGDVARSERRRGIGLGHAEPHGSTLLPRTAGLGDARLGKRGGLPGRASG